MTTPVKINAQMEGDTTAVLSLAGEVDVSNAFQVRDAALKLLSGGAKRLVVDLSGVEYMDSTGLGVLVGIQKRLRETGGEETIAGPRPQVRRIFDITGLAQVFSIYSDVATALQEVRG